MKKRILTTLALLFLGLVTVKAQLNINITQADFVQGSNTTIIMLVDTAPSISVGGLGENQTWDFTGLNPMRIDTNFFAEPATTGVDAKFANANIKWSNSQLTSYLNSTANSINIEGILSDQLSLIGIPLGMGDETPLIFSDPMTMIEFPAAFDSAFKDTSRFIFAIDGAFVSQINAQIKVDSVRIKHTSLIESTMDAEGVVTNPGDTVYNALRQYKVEKRIDTIEVYVTDFLTALGLGVTLNKWSYFEYNGIDNPMLDSAYTYTWYSNNQKFPIITLDVDVNDNVQKATWLYTNNLIGYVASTSNTSCSASSNGSVDLVVAGGTQPYTFLWSDNQTTLNATNLTNGNYVVTISDAMSEKITVSVAVDAEPNWNVLIYTTAMTCDTCNDGKVEITSVGGTSPYVYEWSNGATTPSITGLSGGSNYAVTVTDVNGCSASKSTFISGIDLVENVGFSMFPNPVINKILYINTSEKIELTMYNLLGEQVFYKKVTSNDKIPLGELKSGVYLVQIKSVKGISTKKIIVE